MLESPQKEAKLAQQFGNVKLEIADPNIKVFKCPFALCPEFYVSYDDLKAHEAMKHHTLPAYFNDGTSKLTISKIKGQANRSLLRQKLNAYKAAYSLFYAYSKEQHKQKVAERRANREAEIKTKRIMPEKSVWERLKSWRKRQG
jgi:hypothetical protein